MSAMALSLQELAGWLTGARLAATAPALRARAFRHPQPAGR